MPAPTPAPTPAPKATNTAQMMTHRRQLGRHGASLSGDTGNKLAGTMITGTAWTGGTPSFAAPGTCRMSRARGGDATACSRDEFASGSSSPSFTPVSSTRRRVELRLCRSFA